MDFEAFFLVFSGEAELTTSRAKAANRATTCRGAGLPEVKVLFETCRLLM